MLQKIKDIFTDFSEDLILDKSAALAYYTALALAPLLVLLLWALSLLNIEMQNEMVSQVGQLVGYDGAKITHSIIEGAEKRPDLSSLSGWLAFIGVLISASAIFAQLQSSLNVIFDVTAKDKMQESESGGFWGSIRSLITDRLFSVGMLLTFLFLSTVSLFISSTIAFLMAGISAAIAEGVVWIGNVILFSFLFALIFKWMPDRKINFTSCIYGGALTSVLFVIGKTGISFYLAKAGVGSAYGAAGSLVVILVWVFYSSLIFFLGAETSYAFIVEPVEKGADSKPR